MIFIVLGTQKFQLNRLLMEVDEAIEAGRITQEVIAQVGNSDYTPRNFKTYDYLDKKKFDELVARSRVVITHSGVGSIISAVNSDKPVVVYPRLKKYHEHVDDHQLDIAKAFEKKQYVICCYEGETLQSVLRKCRHFPFQKYHSRTNRIVKMIDDFLDVETYASELKTNIS